MDPITEEKQLNEQLNFLLLLDSILFGLSLKILDTQITQYDSILLELQIIFLVSGTFYYFFGNSSEDLRERIKIKSISKSFLSLLFILLSVRIIVYADSLLYNDDRSPLYYLAVILFPVILLGFARAIDITPILKGLYISKEEEFSVSLAVFSLSYLLFFLLLLYSLGSLVRYGLHLIFAYYLALYVPWIGLNRERILNKKFSDFHIVNIVHFPPLLVTTAFSLFSIYSLPQKIINLEPSLVWIKYLLIILLYLLVLFALTTLVSLLRYKQVTESLNRFLTSLCILFLIIVLLLVKLIGNASRILSIYKYLLPQNYIGLSISPLYYALYAFSIIYLVGILGINLAIKWVRVNLLKKQREK